MWSRRKSLAYWVFAVVLLAGAADARAQGQTVESGWVVDLGIGFAPSINGNVNSGAIGTLQGQTTVILPNTYGDVYGTGIEFRFGGGYVINNVSEVRGMFVWQTADANLVRLGDIGPSNLYVQYSDYKSIGLDFGYRRYVPISSQNVRVFGEVAIGIADIERINGEFAAPQSNATFKTTDFYDSSGAFVYGFNFGGLFRVANHIDLTAQFGLRSVGALAEVDQFVGTGLEDVNSDTARLTFPISVGVRFRFK